MAAIRPLGPFSCLSQEDGPLGSPAPRTRRDGDSASMSRQIYLLTAISCAGWFMDTAGAAYRMLRMRHRHGEVDSLHPGRSSAARPAPIRTGQIANPAHAPGV